MRAGRLGIGSCCLAAVGVVLIGGATPASAQTPAGIDLGIRVGARRLETRQSSPA